MCISRTINRLQAVITLLSVYQDQQQARSKNNYFVLSTTVTISMMHLLEIRPLRSLEVHTAN